MGRIYSLLDVDIIIKNVGFGTITLSGEGKNLGSVSVSRDNEAFTKEDTADGSSVIIVNSSKAGTVEITFKQTSEFKQDLIDLNNYCLANPTKAKCRITVEDDIGNIKAYASNAFPAKLADTEMGQSVGDLVWKFIAERVVMY